MRPSLWLRLRRWFGRCKLEESERNLAVSQRDIRESLALAPELKLRLELEALTQTSHFARKPSLRLVQEEEMIEDLTTLFSLGTQPLDHPLGDVCGRAMGVRAGHLDPQSIRVWPR